jgi:hypothetical protein
MERFWQRLRAVQVFFNYDDFQATDEWKNSEFQSLNLFS